MGTSFWNRVRGVLVDIGYCALGLVLAALSSVVMGVMVVVSGAGAVLVTVAALTGAGLVVVVVCVAAVITAMLLKLRSACQRLLTAANWRVGKNLCGKFNACFWVHVHNLLEWMGHEGGLLMRPCDSLWPSSRRSDKQLEEADSEEVG